MADHVRIYMLYADAMQAAVVHTDTGAPMPLLEWVRRELANDHEAPVARYLLQHAPGLQFVADFHNDWAFDEDVAQFADSLPATLRTRLLGETEAADDDTWDTHTLIKDALAADATERAAFLAAWTSPLRVLNLSGWQFFQPQDIDALLRAYQEVEPNDLHFDEEWQAVLLAHQHGNYDVAVFIYDHLSIV